MDKMIEIEEECIYSPLICFHDYRYGTIDPQKCLQTNIWLSIPFIIMQLLDSKIDFNLLF